MIHQLDYVLVVDFVQDLQLFSGEEFDFFATVHLLPFLYQLDSLYCVLLACIDMPVE